DSRHSPTAPDRTLPARHADRRRTLSTDGRSAGLQPGPGARLPATDATGRQPVTDRSGVRTQPRRGQHPGRPGGARRAPATGGRTHQPLPRGQSQLCPGASLQPVVRPDRSGSPAPAAHSRRIAGRHRSRPAGPADAQRLPHRPGFYPGRNTM
ncbi:Heme d1 biosynthesis protein NirD / Heme d1 biosynthesis protein NirL, partial [Pseudomonas sp. FEN]